jgi:nucleotide sugar dehydrogenase
MTIAPQQAPALSGVALQGATSSVAILGLGYVGLPTALACRDVGRSVVGVDISSRRRDEIAGHNVQLLANERDSLHEALADGTFRLTGDSTVIGSANVVMICVPTPIDERFVPDLEPLAAACQSVVTNAVAGQLIILTSTTYVGCTEDLLAAPLRAKGLEPGRDVHIAFAPERIDPGNQLHDVRTTPRIVGGVSPACTRRAEAFLSQLGPKVIAVSSPQAAEMTKLHENTFRSVNIAYVNELAEACRVYGLDAAEVVDAAATKPYGFMAFYPGPGVGGHCLPCDPHYLLWDMRAQRTDMPVVEAAMAGIRRRPVAIAERVLECLLLLGIAPHEARVLIWGLTYKPNVADLRESPAVHIVAELERRGLRPSVHDSVVSAPPVGRNTARPDEEAWDVVVACTIHSGDDLVWATEGLGDVSCVLDATYRLDGPRVVRP